MNTENWICAVCKKEIPRTVKGINADLGEVQFNKLDANSPYETFLIEESSGTVCPNCAVDFIIKSTEPVNKTVVNTAPAKTASKAA